MNVENVVVESSSIEVNRRARRAKTGRLDVGKLLTSKGLVAGAWGVVLNREWPAHLLVMARECATAHLQCG